MVPVTRELNFLERSSKARKNIVKQRKYLRTIDRIMRDNRGTRITDTTTALLEARGDSRKEKKELNIMKAHASTRRTRRQKTKHVKIKTI